MLHGFNILRQQYSNLSKPGGASQSAISTIQTLAERLAKADENQLSIEDRRAAVLALKGLSRDHNKAVGEHALPALLTSLQRDAKDEDLARALIECCITLCEVQSPESAAQAPAANKKKQQDQGPPSGLQHTDIFLQEPGPLHCLLPLLAPDRAFYTRFASLQLLGSLLRNRPHRVQDHVLVAPGGCGAILECLAEGAGSSAEIVRNEALLLLPHLVYGNADIQKLVAFEGAFEKLLDVCAAEGRIEGGVIVQDALEGLEALLRYNVSNQNYFRETLSIPMLAPLLFYPPGPPNGEFPSKHAEHEYARQLEAFCFQDWDQQKVVNAKIVLDIAGLLIGGQGEGRRANQGALLQCGMTKCLLDLALASTAPASLKAQALHVTASLMQASRANQDLLSTLHVQPVKAVVAPKALHPESQEGDHHEQLEVQETQYSRLEPKSAAVCLVETALGTSGAKGGLGLRAAAIACFRAFVADNMDARLSIINGMAPSAEDKLEGAASAGKALFEAITSNPSTQATSEHADAYKHLMSAMLFSYLVRGSETAKKAARSIAVNPDGTVVKHNRDEQADDDDDDEDDAPSSLIQVIVGNLTLSERELADAVRKERASAMGATVSSSSYSAADWTRIMVGYLVLLSIWLYDSPLSVCDFLSESATLQAVIQPVAQSSGVDPLIQGLAAFLLGVAYEFDTDPGKAALTRATMHPILHSRIGADAFAVRINRISDDVRFRQVTPDVLSNLISIEEHAEADEMRARQIAQAKAAALAAAAAAKAAGEGATSPAAGEQVRGAEDKDKADEEAADKDLEVNGLGHLSKRRRAGLWFDWSFVEFWRANATLIAKSITVDPESSSKKEEARPAELLDAQRQAEALRDTVAKQAREIEVLEKRIDEMTSSHTSAMEELEAKLKEADEAVAAHAPQLQAAQSELEQLKSTHAAALAEIQEKHDNVARQLDEVRAREEQSNGKVLQLTAEIARVSAGKPSTKEFAALQKAHDEVKKKHDDLLSSGGEGGNVGAGVKELMEARERIAQFETQLQARAAEKGDTQTIFSSEEGEEKLKAELDVVKAKLHQEEEARRTLEEKLAEAEKRADAGKEKDLDGVRAEKAELEKKVKTLESASKEKSELEEKVKSLETAQKEKDELMEKVKTLEAVEKEKVELEKKVKTLPQLESAKAELERKLQNLAKLETENKELHAKLSSASSNGGAKDMESLKKEKEEIAKENEDLLVLLEELTQKRKKDKAKLKEKGEEVSEDEDDDEEEEDDDVD